MKKQLKILVIIGLAIIILFSSCDSGHNSFKASLKEAGKEIGIDVPWPHYLPQGFELVSVTVKVNSVVELSAVNKSNQEIKTVISWQLLPAMPYKRFPGYPTIDINGIAGQLIQEDTTTIVWNWLSERYKSGLLVIKVIASNDIPVSDLKSVAESINWDK